MEACHHGRRQVRRTEQQSAKAQSIHVHLQTGYVLVPLQHKLCAILLQNAKILQSTNWSSQRCPLALQACTHPSGTCSASRGLHAVPSSSRCSKLVTNAVTEQGQIQDTHASSAASACPDSFGGETSEGVAVILRPVQGMEEMQQVARLRADAFYEVG